VDVGFPPVAARRWQGLAGAGVVADSDTTYEYNETVTKSKALLRAIALAKTIKG
jgi:anthranilate/para-aminobenzoate synthase component I